MRMMDVASVQRALFQFQIKDYKKLFNDWDPIRNLVVPNKLERATKRHSVTAILNVLKDKRVTKNDIAHLDILYNYYHSRRKVWRVFQFDRIEDEFESVPHTSEDFREKLHVRLSTYFSSEIAVLKIENAYWFRIRVGSNRRRKIPPSITYVVHFPNTRYLVIAGLKSASAKFLLQAFQDTLDCADVEELTLRGRCVSSLAQLAVNKEYRGTGATPPSLTEKIERERSASTMDFDCQIICENKVEHDKRNTLLDDQFGPFVQPALEKVEYKLETKFKGIQYAPAMATSEDLFKCRVKFEGSNVIEGMRELGEAGIAETITTNTEDLTDKEGNVFYSMHSDLAPHLHTEECNKIIAEFHRCHKEHPFKMFIGECNDLDKLMWRCLKKEREQKRIENATKFKRRAQLRDKTECREAES